MKTIHIFLIFLVLALIQLVVPARMIFHKEAIIENGTAYKFKTQPIDPSDPFRGKYITLRYEMNRIKTNDSSWKRKDEGFLYFAEDANGFVQPKRISRKKLETTEDYVVAKVSWYNKNKGEVGFTLPFNRFYMDENKAYDAEVAHRKAQRDSIPDNTYARIYIHDGEAVLSDVYINDIPIKDYVLMDKEKKGEKP